MIGLTRSTAERIRKVIDRSPGNVFATGTGGWKGNRPFLVRCTSATAADATGVGAQCYPGVIVDLDPSETEQEELGDVWLTVLTATDTATQPTADKLYLCFLRGDVEAAEDDTRPRAFALDSGSPSFSGARVYNSTDTTVNTGSNVSALTFDTERFDTDGYHSTSVNQSRFTVATDGYYNIGGTVCWETAAAAYVAGVFICVNGTTAAPATGTFIASVRDNLPTNASTNYFFQTINTMYHLTATDFVELRVHHYSVANRKVYASASLFPPPDFLTPEFWIQKVG